MKIIRLTRHGSSYRAFEFAEASLPKVSAGQALIKSEGFGINFADIMARQGLYQDAPPLPSVLGYEVCGTVTEVADETHTALLGKRVVALTRFGGYAEYAVTDARAVVEIPETLSIPKATALATQYATAYYSAAEMVNLHEGDVVLIHSGAGGVGLALMQYARHQKCQIIATTGSEGKMDFLTQQGAQQVVLTRNASWWKEVKKTSGEVDVIFDAIGGSSMRHGFQLLAPGGRLVCYGASAMSDADNVFAKIAAGIGFGIYHPAQFMMNSKSMIGVNMLRIADHKPLVLQRCMQEVMRLYQENVFTPLEGKLFDASEIAAAHQFIEDRKNLGKVACKW